MAKRSLLQKGMGLPCLALCGALLFACAAQPAATSTVASGEAQSEIASKPDAQDTVPVPEALSPAGELAAFLDARNERAKAEAGMDFTALLTGDMTPSYAAEMTELSEAEIALLLTPQGEATAAGQSEAEEDINWAFTLLRHSYGGYGYWGGEAAFEAARQSALRQLAGAGDTIQPGTLAGILAESLQFITDLHFSIDGAPLNEAYIMYQAEGLYMEAAQDVYVLQQAGEGWVLEGADGLLPADIVRPTIDENGRIVYGLFLQGPEGTSLPESARFTRGEEAEEVPLEWRACPAASPGGDEMALVEMECVRGVPLHRIHRMYTYMGEDEAEGLAQMAQSGEACRAEPLFVVDLRANGGGSDDYPFTWFDAYNGGVPISRAAASIFTPLAVASLPWDVSETTAFYANEIAAGQWVGGGDVGAYKPDESLTFVLLDKGTASGGEDMALQFGNLENTLLAGSPTLGCGLVGNVTPKYLPHSGLELVFGNTLFLSQISEGKGLLPDLWVNPALAEERVLAMIDYYGINVGLA